ncbi:hypothetical protein V6N13_053403 [Hibiscus sabdariffa]|uniref:UspA domain-containing protein n=1 Tax=Hibiscus sabdariffa TaxID=183260 RepID=A0ABR2T8J6_9ROSI
MLSAKGIISSSLSFVPKVTMTKVIIYQIVSTAARQNQVEVLMKIYWGDPREKLCEAIDQIPLSCIIVGNRGLGKLKRAIMGSVSNYVVNNGSCPVTVVKHHD